MGNLCGGENEQPEKGYRNRSYKQDDEINRMLNNDRDNEAQRIKLLLLGPGESGKSTIFRQMRILYGEKRTDEDKRMYGVYIRYNITSAVRKLCQLTRSLGYEERLDKEGRDVREAYDQLVAYLVDFSAIEPMPPVAQAANDWVGTSHIAGGEANRGAQEFLQHVEAIRILWASPTIQEVWTMRARVNIIDSHNEYLNDISRIASPKYIPTEHDILNSRVRTTQVTDEKYIIDNVEFKIVDVGGQRAERRKWINCFSEVDAIIFVAALSEYDQFLSESPTVNRMTESLNLFKSIVQDPLFIDKPVLLFLNKKDIFSDKIMYSNIADQVQFADYEGPIANVDDGLLYFVEKFQALFPNPNEVLDEGSYIHFTTATDTDNMEFVLDSARSIIMSEAMRGLNIVPEDDES